MSEAKVIYFQIFSNVKRESFSYFSLYFWYAVFHLNINAMLNV
jgi:hypothetical protein